MNCTIYIAKVHTFHSWCIDHEWAIIEQFYTRCKLHDHKKCSLSNSTPLLLNWEFFVLRSFLYVYEWIWNCFGSYLDSRFDITIEFISCGFIVHDSRSKNFIYLIKLSSKILDKNVKLWAGIWIFAQGH